MLNQSKIRAGLKVATRKVEWLHFIDGATEIGQALNIGHEAAAMLLYGLCATANVKSANDKGETFEPDECTLEDLERKQPALVRASDVRHWLSEWSSASQLKLRDTAIANRLPRNVSWKAITIATAGVRRASLHGALAISKFSVQSKA